MNDYMPLLVFAAFVVMLGTVMRAGAGSGGNLRRIENKLDRIAEHLEIELKPKLPGDVVEMAQSGRKIDAIKRLREQQPGLGLKDAKDLIDMVA